jgi:hypothetical protein
VLLMRILACFLPLLVICIAVSTAPRGLSLISLSRSICCLICSLCIILLVYMSWDFIRVSSLPHPLYFGESYISLTRSGGLSLVMSENFSGLCSTNELPLWYGVYDSE